MKKVLNSTAFLLSAVIIFLLTAGWFGYKCFNAYNELSAIQKAERKNIEVTTVSPTTKTANQVKIDELQEEVEQSKETDTSTVRTQIDSFLTEFDSALDYDVSAYPTYKEKQNYVMSRLKSYFTEDGFRNSPYYEIVTKPETYTYEKKRVDSDETFVAEYKNRISSQRYKFKNVYYRIESDTKASVFIELADDNYLMLDMIYETDSWKISSYEMIY